ncbi:anti-sigma factor [Oceanobacillus luteolus]|uniref:Anti sigma factor C-terminal domain-containing protein n=1 Tax=Oceanobacillus luteolus TaxID=1274358 RepID=A0ABW4HTN9_9BACI
MDKEQFNDLLNKYKQNKLSKEEEILFEKELDKYESYQDFLDGESEKDYKKTISNPPSKHMKSLNKGKRKAIISNALMTIAIALMILPICTIFSFVYYGYGIADSRGNNFIQVAADTISITEPNATVDFQNIRTNVGLFSMEGDFDIYKQIGNNQKHLRTDNLTLFLNKVDQPERLKEFNAQKFSHPENPSLSTTNDVNQQLQNLPDGTVSEVFVSLDAFYSEEEIKNIFSDIELDILWYAVNTGIVDDTKYTAIGYPAQDGDINSSFNNKEENSKQFIEVLNRLNKYQDWAETITQNRSLNINEVTKFIDENGIEIYGVVVTGPTKELLKLNEIPEVTNQNLGGVELWNWR